MDMIDMQKLKHGRFIEEMVNANRIIAASFIDIDLGKTTALPHFPSIVKLLVIARIIYI